jgi:molybdate transport repressor ModE-like protein
MSQHTIRRRLKKALFVPRVKDWLEVEGRYAFGLGIAEILQAVGQAGSIKQAAANLGKSYRHVWGRIQGAEDALGRLLVGARVVGHGPQRSALTDEARRLVAAFLALRARMFEAVRDEFDRLFP